MVPVAEGAVVVGVGVAVLALDVLHDAGILVAVVAGVEKAV